MKAFFGCFLALIMSVGIFFGVAGIMGAQHKRGVIEEIKSWGQVERQGEVVVPPLS